MKRKHSAVFGNAVFDSAVFDLTWSVSCLKLRKINFILNSEYGMT